jgi:hypothetical protein
MYPMGAEEPALGMMRNNTGVDTNTGEEGLLSRG